MKDFIKDELELLKVIVRDHKYQTPLVQNLSDKIESLLRGESEIDQIIEIIGDSEVDGSHHKQWIIDQIARVVKAHQYQRWRNRIKLNGYEWEEGIAP